MEIERELENSAGNAALADAIEKELAGGTVPERELENSAGNAALADAIEKELTGGTVPEPTSSVDVDDTLLKLASDLRRLLEDRGWPADANAPSTWDAAQYGPLVLPNLPPIEVVTFHGDSQSTRELVPQLFPPLATRMVVAHQPGGEPTIQYIPVTTPGEICFPIACPPSVMAWQQPGMLPNGGVSAPSGISAPVGAPDTRSLWNLYREPGALSPVISPFQVSGNATASPPAAAPSPTPGVREGIRDAVSERLVEGSRDLGQMAGDAYRNRTGEPQTRAESIASAIPGELMHRAGRTFGERVLLTEEERVIARLPSGSSQQGGATVGTAAVEGFLEKAGPVQYLLKQGIDGMIEPVWSYVDNGIERVIQR